MASTVERLDVVARAEVAADEHLNVSKAAPEDVFLGVLDETCSALDDEGVPYGLLGGIASSALGRHRWTHDIDIFVRPEDVERVLTVLARRGFAVQRTNPYWLYKAVKDDVLVDILFRAKGDITYDAEMVRRTRNAEFGDRAVRVIAPEDLLVIKAVVHDEETPRHWYDALGLLTAADIDWDYLLERARVSPRRILSLLFYAQSMDHVIPNRVVRELFDAVTSEEDESGRPA